MLIIWNYGIIRLRMIRTFDVVVVVVLVEKSLFCVRNTRTNFLQNVMKICGFFKCLDFMFVYISGIDFIVYLC